MDIKIEVDGKPVNAFLALPAGGTGPGVLVLHAWWGLNSFFKDLCGRLAAEGFVALAPDLYHGPIADTVEGAQSLADSADQKQIGDTIHAAMDYLGSLPAATGDRISLVGFSMGAAWVLLTASKSSYPIGASVVFYGAYNLDFSKMKSKFMGHFSNVDAWEPIEGIRGMQQSMQQAGVDAVYHFYPGLPHWFCETDRPEYDPAAAELAWKRTISFLQENA